MKILVIRIKGIGNTVMFTPALAALRKALPNADIVFLADTGSAEVVRGSNLVDEIIHFDLGWSLSKKIKVICNLRREKFDYSIMTFPANKVQFNILAFLIGASKRVTHKYGNSKVKTLSFLQNVKIPAVEGVHDVDQNLNLLKAFNIQAEDKEQHFYISKDDMVFAESFFREKGLGRAIAMHPGCGDDSLYKRWPSRHFTSLIKLLNDNGHDVILIAGPGEQELVSNINEQLANKAVVLQDVNLKKVAAVISLCSSFLSTDSGLGHIAAAMNVPTLAITGPTDYRRIAPYGKKCRVLTKGLECSPCKKYPFHTDYSHIRCSNIRCLNEISPEEVRDKLLSLI